MDATDRKILAALVQDGRLSLTDLADQVHLSLSPCHRRLRKLEGDGVIAGYHADVSPQAVGLHFEALVFVTMSSGKGEILQAFEAAVRATPAVVAAQRLFGEPDYLLRILTADLPAYQEIYDTRLSDLPGVQRLTSTLVMKNVIDHRPPPFQTP